MIENSRPGWDEYFMDIAHVAANRSSCSRRKVAAVIVRNRQIVSTGYNGTPKGIKNCDEGGCPRCNSTVKSGHGLADCLCCHAEENAIVQASKHGISVDGSMLYTTYSPCLLCAKMIINSGIKEVVFHSRYSIDDVSSKILHEAGVNLRPVKDENAELKK
ncbi:MAG: dCMP deaminase family protein [Lentisphaeraceae bacterium]|nr:dCMP deaminase family protein [Lentisphaeraceae bacterium]